MRSETDWVRVAEDFSEALSEIDQGVVAVVAVLAEMQGSIRERAATLKLVADSLRVLAARAETAHRGAQLFADGVARGELAECIGCGSVLIGGDSCPQCGAPRQTGVAS